MSNVLERHGDNVRKAIVYIDELKKVQPDKTISQFISEAGAKFNLTPKDEEFLIIFFKDK